MKVPVSIIIVRGGAEGLRDNSGNQFDGNSNGVPEESPVDDYYSSFKVIDTYLW